MTGEKKDIKEKAPEHPKKKEGDANDFQSIYDKIITAVTKRDEKK